MEEHKHKGQQGQSEAFERRLKLTNTVVAIAMLSKGRKSAQEQTPDDKTNSTSKNKPQSGR